jgi:hypothetical protein
VRCPTCSRYWAWSPMTEQTEDPFDLPLDDECDVEPGDDGDIRDPEAFLARMPGLLPGPGGMKLDPHEY